MPPDLDSTPSILVIEDEPDFASLISIVLRNAGYSVRTASNGEEALAEMYRRKPDLITLDLQIPGKSGAHFYHEIRSQKKYLQIPVIVITGLRGNREADDVIRSFLGAGGKPVPEAYFDKSFNRQKFLETVRNCLQRAESSRGNTPPARVPT